jgi:hypothetical protein
MHVCLVACLPGPFIFFGVGQASSISPQTQAFEDWQAMQVWNSQSKTKRKGRILAGETGSEVEVEAVPAKKAKNSGGVGLFEAKFKQAGTKPVQVWEGKYVIVLKDSRW